jgi:hypothetical protein
MVPFFNFIEKPVPITMKILFALLFLANLAIPGHSQSSADEMIRTLFAECKDAVNEGDGKKAIQYFNRKSRTYFSKILDLALRADSASVRRLNLVERLDVLLTRQMFTPSELKSFSLVEDDLLRNIIEKGVILKTNLSMINVLDITIKGDTAFARVTNDQPPAYIKFTKEETTWKLDFTSSVQNAPAFLQVFILTNGWTEDEFINRSLKAISGREVKSTIWRSVAR